MSRSLREGPAPQGPFDVAVIGAGAVGCAVAREVSRRGASCALIEAGPDVGAGTSKANTAILHTGFDAKPGTIESGLVARGYELLSAVRGRGRHPDGEPRRADDRLERRAARRPGRDRGEGARERVRGSPAGRPGRALRPRAAHRPRGAQGALEIPGEGIVCPFTTTLAFATEAVGGGMRAASSTRRSRGVRAEGGGHEIDTARGPVRAQYLVNAAGLRSDEVDAMLGHYGFTVTPRRGELIVFDKLAPACSTTYCSRCPRRRPRASWSRRRSTATSCSARPPTTSSDKTDRSTTEAGLASLMQAGARIMPALERQEVTATYVGLRAATEHRDYQLTAHAEQRYVCAGGIRSTGITGSLAIAEWVREALADAGLDAGREPEASGLRMPNIGEFGARPYQEGGRIICFCERVTRGEVEAALASPIPPADLDGLRRRTRVLMGRCQGFFCGAEVAAALEGGVDHGDR